MFEWPKEVTIDTSENCTMCLKIGVYMLLKKGAAQKWSYDKRF